MPLPHFLPQSIKTNSSKVFLVSLNVANLLGEAIIPTLAKILQSCATNFSN